MSATTTAKGSPTYRTRSRASASRWNGSSSSPPGASTLPAGGCGGMSQVIGRVDGRHPRHPPGLVEALDAPHHGMREDGADEHGPEGPGDRHVLQVPPLATQEPRVFGPERRDAEDRRRHERHAGHARTSTEREDRCDAARADDRRCAAVVAPAGRQRRATAVRAARAAPEVPPSRERRGRRPVRAVPVQRRARPARPGSRSDPDGRIWYLERGTGGDRSSHPRRTATGSSRTSRRQRRRRARRPGHRAAPRLPVAAVRVRLRDAHRRRTLVNEVLRFRSEGGDPAGTRVLFRWAVAPRPTTTAGTIAVRARREPLDHHRREREPRVQPAAREPPREDPADQARRVGPEHEPVRDPHLRDGIRNSFGLAFDPRTDRPGRRENGPAATTRSTSSAAAATSRGARTSPAGRCPTPRDTNRDGANRSCRRSGSARPWASRARRSAGTAVWAPAATATCSSAT